MVSTKGLCCTIALLCVVVPIIVGHVMPSGSTDDNIGYESGNRVNITSDLLNSGDYTFTTSTALTNNYRMVQEYPVKTSTTVSPIPAYGAVTTTTHAGDSYIDFLGDYNTYTVFEPTSMVEDNFVISIPGGGHIRGTTVSWNPAINELIFYNVQDYPIIVPQEAFINKIYCTYEYVSKQRTVSLTNFVQPDYGAKIGYSSTIGYPTTWNNGNYNTGVSFIITDSSYGSGDWGCMLYITSVDPGYTAGDAEPPLEFTIHIGVTDGKWNITKYPGAEDAETRVLGSFKQVLLTLDGLSNSATLTGLVYNSNLTVSPEGREMGSVTVSEIYRDDPDVIYSYYPESIEFNASTANRMTVYCSSANIITGSQPVIKDNHVSLSNYFPGKSFSYEISSVGIYGSSLTVSPGMAINQTPVEDRSITFTDIDGNEHTEKVNGLIILAVYDADTSRYTVSVNGYVIQEAAASVGMSFGGEWLFTGMIYEVTEYTYSTYEFDFTKLNVSHNEYCLIGLITAALTFVAAAMVGKKSGTKVIWSMMISALAAIIYLGMFE